MEFADKGVNNPKVQVSPFNDGFGTLARIGIWWHMANKAAYELNFYDRFNALDRVNEELYAWGTAQEIKDLEKNRNDVLYWIPSAYIKNGELSLLNIHLINALDKYAKSLRILAHRAQLDMKAQESEEHLNDEMM